MLAELEPWGENPKSISKASAKRLLDYWQRIGQFATIAIGPKNGNGKYPVYDGHQRLHVLKTAYGGQFAIDARVSERPLTKDERAEMVVQAHAGTVGNWDWDALAAWDTKALESWGLDSETLGQWGQDYSGLTELLESGEDYSDLDNQLNDLVGFDEVDIKITVASKYKDEVEEWLANGNYKTAPGFGKGVLKRCGLL